MPKQVIYIKENALLARLAAKCLKSERMAVAFGQTIYLHNTSKAIFLSQPTWVNHELTHILQSQRLGVLVFLIHYVWESLRNGYQQNKYEIEARQQENNHQLQAQFVLQ